MSMPMPLATIQPLSLNGDNTDTDGMKHFVSMFRNYRSLQLYAVILMLSKPLIDTYSNKFTEDVALSYRPESEFRENFERLFEAGFSDAFRILNPDKEGIYSWWGPKNKDRLENCGSRLDYILVSDELLNYIMSVEYHSDIVGSDHCPVSIVITPPILYPDQKSEDLVSRWQATDWTEIEILLFNMQTELFEAAIYQD